MQTLKELIESTPDDLTKELKCAFRPLTPHITIDGKELDALTILVNLTDKTNVQKDLLDRTKCKQKLRDDKWWAGCINCVKYRQSHNPKFPDIRSDGVIRASTLGSLPEYLLSSSKLPQYFWAYSHDSKSVNKSAFLTNEFGWNGGISCLAELLKDEDHPLWKTLTKLGCYQKTRKAIAKKLASIAHATINVPLVTNYLTQISLPDGDSSYISLSPVTSLAMQSHFHQGLQSEYQYTATTRYSWPTNMGVTAMACGGAFRMLKSNTKFSTTPHHRLNSKHSWLTSEHVQSLTQYKSLNKRLMPENARKALRRKCKIEILNMVSAWLTMQDHTLDSTTLVQHLNHDLSCLGATKRFAYDPGMTKLFTELLKRALANSINDGTQHTNGSYLVLPNIRVCGATALSSPVTVGGPSLTAFFGFVHAFERKLNSIFTTFRVESFAICVHELHVEKRGLTAEFVEKANGIISAPATRDDWQCDLIFSLVLNTNVAQCIDQSIVIKSLPKRLARGLVRIAIGDFKYINSFSGIEKAIQSLPIKTGRWLSLYTESINDVGELLAALKEDHQLMASCVGYHLLEEPKDKPNSLRGYKHAFAESIVGLIKLITLNQTIDANTILWSLKSYQNFLVMQPRSINDEITDESSL
ncbi:type I-F CRISPR-associated protein Csy2 [Photobacterium leiognathi]|uniref:type I-F CRISPR-associated protein Csy2 n=1 Tax=Photobacterium leiognathi TaxID=553611 RepID=UPI00273816E7|nr:type I-F CRISPR-associated protein Csy2 [Photobacterium leiognathi]